MRFLNAELEFVYKFLMDEPLSGKESRMRTRFCKLLAERIKQMQDEKMEIIKRYGRKNEDGSIATKTDKNGKEIYDITDVSSFNKEYKELMLEECVIDETEERELMLTTVRNVVLNTKKVFSNETALQYDRLCETFENIYPE